MKEHKEGTLKSGSGKKVKSRKQAVAIALSEARKCGSEDSQKEKEVLAGAPAAAGRPPAAAGAEMQDGIGADAGSRNRHKVNAKTKQA